MEGVHNEGDALASHMGDANTSDATEKQSRYILDLQNIHVKCYFKMWTWQLESKLNISRNILCSCAGKELQAANDYYNKRSCLSTFSSDCSLLIYC